MVGKDQIGIVAKITTTLYESGCNLGETSMLRLGGNFSIMLMVNYDGSAESLHNLLKPVADQLQLHLHIDSIEGQLHQHQIPNLRVRVYGADRIGIVAQVSTALAKAGFNILNLESDVGGDQTKPFYIINIEGFATAGIEAVETALQKLSPPQHDLEVKLEPNVIRAKNIHLQALDENGIKHEYDMEGYEARAVQHEIDHLDGLLFLDRLVSRRHDLFQRQY